MSIIIFLGSKIKKSASDICIIAIPSSHFSSYYSYYMLNSIHILFFRNSGNIWNETPLKCPTNAQIFLNSYILFIWICKLILG